MHIRMFECFPTTTGELGAADPNRESYGFNLKFNAEEAGLKCNHSRAKHNSDSSVL